ncbi:hypothetical protein CPHO_07200 [Corynebacterium phocae]|uniref:Uncharacterized protein n=1 Tax=Corynebacterium phocae TaxID=161895 RepID=A0A1L7D455_9CORY|nr:hypothetical protein [Corynebacterium phocae]APT92712.1 hypothetical protein CPHO_07200 [Corynebacterium phocae]KAA8723017.1 hypothetical protein F4V58_06705 [Corynebacterium phocae]
MKMNNLLKFLAKFSGSGDDVEEDFALAIVGHVHEDKGYACAETAVQLIGPELSSSQLLMAYASSFACFLDDLSPDQRELAMSTFCEYVALLRAGREEREDT